MQEEGAGSEHELQLIHCSTLLQNEAMCYYKIKEVFGWEQKLYLILNLAGQRLQSRVHLWRRCLGSGWPSVLCNR